MTQKTFENFDKLDLKSFAKVLLIDIRNGMKRSKEGAYTISLDAGFGKGKTTFLEMFENMISGEKGAITSVEGNTNTNEAIQTSNSTDKEPEYTVFTINAWKTERYGDPAVAILNEFIDFLRSDKRTYIRTEKEKKQLIKDAELAIRFVINLVPGLPGPVKVVYYVVKIIRWIFPKKKDLHSIHATTDKIKQVMSDYKKKTKRDLIIVVDELDRVKPDYAVDFLEAIKHFFDVPKICFLFAVNRQQIETTVKGLFGGDLDFAGYYDKFFQREFSLTNAYSQAVRNYIQKEIERFEQQSDIRFDKAQKNIGKWFALYEIFDLSLRQTQQWIRISHKAFDKYIREILADEKQPIKNRERLFDILEQQLSGDALRSAENKLNEEIERLKSIADVLTGKDKVSERLPEVDKVYSIDFYLVLFYTALYIKQQDLFIVETTQSIMKQHEEKQKQSSFSIAKTTQPIMERHKKIHDFVERYPNTNSDYLRIKTYLILSLSRKDMIFKLCANIRISDQKNQRYTVGGIDSELPPFKRLGIDPEDVKLSGDIYNSSLRFTIFDITPETLFNIISHP